MNLQLDRPTKKISSMNSVRSKRSTRSVRSTKVPKMRFGKKKVEKRDDETLGTNFQRGVEDEVRMLTAPPTPPAPLAPPPPLDDDSFNSECSGSTNGDTKDTIAMESPFFQGVHRLLGRHKGFQSAPDDLKSEFYESLQKVAKVDAERESRRAQYELNKILLDSMCMEAKMDCLMLCAGPEGMLPDLDLDSYNSELDAGSAVESLETKTETKTKAEAETKAEPAPESETESDEVLTEVLEELKQKGKRFKFWRSRDNKEKNEAKVKSKKKERGVLYVPSSSEKSVAQSTSGSQAKKKTPKEVPKAKAVPKRIVAKVKSEEESIQDQSTKSQSTEEPLLTQGLSAIQDFIGVFEMSPVASAERKRFSSKAKNSKARSLPKTPKKKKKMKKEKETPKGKPDPLLDTLRSNMNNPDPGEGDRYQRVGNEVYDIGTLKASKSAPTSSRYKSNTEPSPWVAASKPSKSALNLTGAKSSSRHNDRYSSGGSIAASKASMSSAIVRNIFKSNTFSNSPPPVIHYSPESEVPATTSMPAQTSPYTTSVRRSAATEINPNQTYFVSRPKVVAHTPNPPSNLGSATTSRVALKAPSNVIQRANTKSRYTPAVDTQTTQRAKMKPRYAPAQTAVADYGSGIDRYGVDDIFDDL